LEAKAQEGKQAELEAKIAKRDTLRQSQQEKMAASR